MIITDFVMEARPFFESQIKIKDSTWYLLSKILVLQQSAVGSSLVGEFSLCIVTSDNTVTGLESGHTAVKDVDPKQDHFLNFV